MTVRECIEKFINTKSRHPEYPKKMILGLLGSEDKADSFMWGISNYLDTTTINAADYAREVQLCVRSYIKNKDNAIKVFRKLTEYLHEKLKCDLPVTYPPIPVSSSFERLMFISKYLQDANHKVSDLEDILWVSSRTIQEDLKRLQGKETEDLLSICGRTFTIVDAEKKDGTLIFKSTVHPFFLTCNLTQVIVMLEGLRTMSEKPELKPYALSMAADIWDQLSEYGKNRIRFVLTELMPMEYSWVESLEENIYRKFTPESLCSMSLGGHAILECLKNGMGCYIEYDNNGETQFFEDVEVLKYDSSRVLIKDKAGKSKWIDENNILRSSTSKQGLL